MNRTVTTERPLISTNQRKDIGGERTGTKRGDRRNYAALNRRPQGQQYGRSDNGGAQHRGPSFHHPRTSLGVSSHWIHLAAVAAPLVIGELVQDSEKRWRYLRVASVVTALASEAVWTHRLSKDRQKDEDTREALAACHDR